jgi:hypothetical protein
VKVATGTATAVLAIFGFRTTSVTASGDGSAVHATIASAQACDAVAATEHQVAARIEHVVRSVRSVTISVSGTNESLSQYDARSCTFLRIPGGPGRIVLTLHGVGFFNTRSFRIHSRRWTIGYIDKGRFLELFASKGSLPTGKPILAISHSAGRRIEYGAGTYSLRIMGLGYWVVQVRDGA